MLREAIETVAGANENLFVHGDGAGEPVEVADTENLEVRSGFYGGGAPSSLMQ
jgi:hypothetical protein